MGLEMDPKRCFSLLPYREWDAHYLHDKEEPEIQYLLRERKGEPVLVKKPLFPLHAQRLSHLQGSIQWKMVSAYNSAIRKTTKPHEIANEDRPNRRDRRYVSSIV